MKSISIYNVVFDYMNKDDVIAHVEIKDGAVKIKRYEGLCPLHESMTTVEEVLHALRDMIVPETRANIKEVLHSLGLEEYDVFKIVRKTRGILYNNFSWIRFSDEMDFNPIPFRKKMGMNIWRAN